MKKRLVARYAIALLVSLLGAGVLAGQKAAADTKVHPEDAVGFKEFMARVNEYEKLRDGIEKKLPPLKSKEELPEMITAHQQALERKIREARPNAKPGDIFTHESREAFRHVVRRVFKESHTVSTRSTIRQKDGPRSVRLQVNGHYPDSIAETTVPPTLLQNLPTLPDELVYRIVGRTLYLVDRKANLVVDLLHDALPQN